MTTPEDRDEDALDERYRRARDATPVAPSAAVRAAILAEGRRIAAEQRRATRPARFDTRRPAANDRHWTLAALGTLVAAVIAGLIVTPIYREAPETPVATISNPGTAGPAVSASRPPAREDAREVPAAAANRAESLQRAAPSQPPAAPAPLPRLAAPPPVAEASGQIGPRREPSVDLPIVAGPPPPEAIAASADSTSRLAAKSAGAARAASGAAAPAAAARGDLESPSAALHRAVTGDDVALVGRLLDAGASPTEPDAEGRSPLLLATIAGRAGAVRLLLAHGADPNDPGRNGRTPLAEARARHLDEIAALLERAGAR